ncbi:MAG: hypothetical protein IPN12_12985 [Rhodocyclaceae bacterium]|nr:hypothetical protein [Rhodocyclaceae bacterium]
MKRHQKLQDLSREHHGALQLALKAKRAAMSGDLVTIATTAAACLSAFHSELDPHFVIEENTLLPLLAIAGEDRLARQVEHDHKELHYTDCLSLRWLRQPFLRQTGTRSRWLAATHANRRSRVFRSMGAERCAATTGSTVDA